MLSKANRLKKQSEITKVFNKGDSIKGSSLICKYYPNNESQNKSCFTIAKKIKTNAVTRNRLRRQMAYAYKNSTETLNQKVHYDFVFILYKIPSKNFSRYESLCKDFTLILQKLTDKNV